MPVGNYNSTFVVSGTTAGFDVRGESGSYSSTVEANQTVEAIPWAQTYSVVRHYAGLTPHKRNYRVLFWAEADFITMALAVGATGTLTTPREGGVTAALDRIERGQDNDRSTPTGMTSANLYFTLLA